MSTDWTQLVNSLFPEAGGEPSLVLRTGTVDAENVDGTIDLELSGVIIPSVPVIDGAITDEDSVVMVLSATGTLLVLGSIQVSPPVPVAGVPVGSILEFSGSSAPSGFLMADGTSKATADYPGLFAVIGYTYGGYGANFNLPNRKGRVGVGRDAGQAEFNTLGETGGAKTHTLTVTEIPAHSHSAISTAGTGGGGTVANWTVGGASTANHTTFGITGTTGSSGAHNNLQPYIAINYIIKT